MTSDGRSSSSLKSLQRQRRRGGVGDEAEAAEDDVDDVYGSWALLERHRVELEWGSTLEHALEPSGWGAAETS